MSDFIQTRLDAAATFLTPLGDAIHYVWTHGFMGVNVGSLLLSILIIMASLMVRGLFTRYIVRQIRALLHKGRASMPAQIIDALIPPVRFIPIVLGLFIAGNTLNLNADGISGDIFQRFMRTLITFTLFWAIHRSIKPVSTGMEGLNKILTPLMVNWIFRIARMLVIFVGGAIILEAWGIKVAPLLAGLGLFGAAIALGAQDLFKNLIGGITIIAEKRFQPGDWIHVEGVVEGTVEDINFRSTLVRRFDKAPVHVPNTMLADSVVTNFSRMTHRRIKWNIGVTYDTSIDQLKIIRDHIMTYIEDNPAFTSADEVATFVRIDRFDDSAITFLIYCFTSTTNWGEWLQIKEDFACAIKDIVEKTAKTAFAFPSHSVYVETLPEILQPHPASPKPGRKTTAPPTAKA